VTAAHAAGRRLALAGVIGSGALGVMNVAVGVAQGSTSVLASGLEFLGDVLASAVVYLGMTLAARPADANHPYGHGRYETLAGMAVGVFLVTAGAGICVHALRAVGEVHPPPGTLGLWALGIAIAAKTGLSLVKYRYGKRLRSSSLMADAWNDAVDVFSGLAALAALGLTLYDPARFLAADHYGGFVVGVVVAVTGLRVARDASLELIDTSPEGGMLEAIRCAAREVEGVRGIDKCLARKSGLQYHVDLHVEVDPALTVRAAHEIGGAVRTHLRQRYNWVADVLVHIEPAPHA
jgi:cation diffusion facilitator family transporter